MQDTQTLQTILVLSALILLPLIPSYLLFKVLPGTAIVKGLLAGLSVNLGGAFGGYIALTVFFSTFAAQQDLIHPAATWHVRGRVAVEQATPHSANAKCAVIPSATKCPIELDGSFDCNVPVPDHAVIPSFVFTADGYEDEPASLSDPGRPGNFKAHMQDTTTILFDEPIVLHKSNGGAAQPTTVAQPITTGG